MRTLFFRTVIIAFWLVMTGWLLRYEAFPEKFSGSTSGYRSLLEQRPLVFDSWMQIEYQNLPIGYSHTWIDASLKYDAPAYVLKNQTILDFKLMGQEQWVNISADASLDEDYSLREFSARMSSSLYSTKVTADRIRDDLFAVNITTPAGEKKFELTIPRDVVLYSPMIEMTMKNLNPGQSMRFKTVDPLSLAVTDLAVEAFRRENIVFEGTNKPATLLNVSYQGMNVSTWIDADGRILRQETPFGWVIRASSPREIVSRRRQRHDMADIFSSMSVPVRGRITAPRGSKRLKVRLNGRFSETNGLSNLPGQRPGHRQFVEEQLDDAVIMELEAQQIPSDIIGFDKVPEELCPFLAASAAIQADNEKMIRQAKAIVGNASNCFEAAKSINEWVFSNVVKKPTVSLPSALDVLQRLEGDCNEHTYLFVALARAAGLPALVNVGIVYAENGPRGAAFYYHAWPSVFVGEWIEMDPTFGIPLVDAAYIRLVSGEIEEQLKLLSVLGSLSVDILEEE